MWWIASEPPERVIAGSKSKVPTFTHISGSLSSAFTYYSKHSLLREQQFLRVESVIAGILVNLSERF